MGNIIGWIVFGIVAGAIARVLHPGPDRMGLVSTTLLGVVGSFVGGGIAYVLRLETSPYQPGGWLLSILGSVLLLTLGFFSKQARSLH
ncbi:GlsB/YeaQ/YmgE family stress response membrane protein [Singulisphaera rosea]